MAARSRSTSRLHLAAERGHDDVIAALARGGAELDAAGLAEGCTAAYLLAGLGHVSGLRVLVDAGALLDKPTVQGNTPAMVHPCVRQTCGSGGRRSSAV